MRLEDRGWPVQQQGVQVMRGMVAALAGALVATAAIGPVWYMQLRTQRLCVALPASALEQGDWMLSAKLDEAAAYGCGRGLFPPGEPMCASYRTIYMANVKALLQ
jgi:hypothetical protein